MTIKKHFKLMVLITILFSSLIFAQQWGLIRYAHSSINIRSDRSVNSKIVGEIKSGQKIKVDFLKDNWFAVFDVNESLRDESKSLGYVFSPLLKPNPLTEKSSVKKPIDILKYNIITKEDVSYAGTSRMVYRIVVEVNQIPSKEQLKKTSNYIWEKSNKNWKEFTVFTYLPDMDSKSVAYGVAEYSSNDLKKFSIQEYALYGTKWKN